MARKFVRLIPRTPIFRREIYDIPNSYSEVYKEKGIADLDEQKALFYVTQFGGFRLKKTPSYFEDKENFFSEWFKTKYENSHIQFKANANFVSNFGNIEIQPLSKKSYSEKHYKDSFLIENNINIKDSREIEEFLDKLNLYYSSLRVNLKIPASGIVAEDRIDLTRFNSIPNFNYKPFAGNRLFHSGPGSSFQRISSNLRPFLTINNKATTEIDISASTIQFLNIVLEKYTGTAPMSKSNLSQGDPYEYFLRKINSPDFKKTHNLEKDLDRDSLKDLLYTLIYSTLTTQRANVNRHLKLKNLGFFYCSIKEEFPQFFESIEKLKTIPLEANGKKNGDNFQPHLLIFREESKYAREILKRCCLEEKFPVLPLHDSFIAPAEEYSRLEKVICDVSNEFYDYVLVHKKKF